MCVVHLIVIGHLGVWMHPIPAGSRTCCRFFKYWYILVSKNPMIWSSRAFGTNLCGKFSSHTVYVYWYSTVTIEYQSDIPIILTLIMNRITFSIVSLVWCLNVDISIYLSTMFKSFNVCNVSNNPFLNFSCSCNDWESMLRSGFL